MPGKYLSFSAIFLKPPQHSRLVEAELCIVQSELSKARRDLRQLADLYQSAADELARLKVAHEALGKERNRLYVECVGLKNRINYTPYSSVP
ncbi:MAG TPA: hypothetical protein DCR78_20215 [Pseudomonas sp.]|nr:hypothetical protein [Pseudomonas sp.]HAW22280.1 hypothetical protein [Pseudomonas sp.]